MKEYTWRIESKNDNSRTMIVEYTYENRSTRLNIPQPTTSVDVHQWINRFAPVAEWEQPVQEFAQIEAGAAGVGQFGADVDSETPNLIGSWNEEYLRAMIYQVLEEMREAQV